MKRVVLIAGAVAAVVVVIVVVVFVFVLGNLDSLVKQAIEGEGSRVAGVPVSVSEVQIDLFDGRGAIGGLTVGNPQGFKSDNAIALSGISVQVDTESVGDPVIVIREITVERPEVTYELAAGGNNIDIIAANVQRRSGSGSGGSSGSGGQAGGGDGDSAGEEKLVIENLYIRGGRVTLAAALLEGEGLEAALPDIHLKDIGKDSGGATPDEVAVQVMAALTAAASQAAADLGVGKTLEALQQNLDKLEGGQIDSEQAKQAIEEAGKELDKAGESLKRLFGD